MIDADGQILGMTRMVHITDYPCFHEKEYYTPGDWGAPVYDTAAGNVLARAGQGTDEILTCEVDLAEVANSHARQLFLRDRRPEPYDE